MLRLAPGWFEYKIRLSQNLSQKVWQSTAGAGLLLLLVAFPVPAQSPPPSSLPTAVPQPTSSSSPSQSTSSPTARSLRVAIRPIKPDVFEEQGKLVGFSIDLGQSLLKQLQKQEVLKSYADVPEVLNAIRSQQADIGLAAIAITSQLEQEFDFSYPVLTGSLQIMVLTRTKQARPIEQELLRRLSEPRMLRLFGVITLLMLIPAHLVWFFERQESEIIENHTYIPGIFQSIWWTVLALFGQADAMPTAFVGKIVGLFWVVIGIVFVAFFTANITAELTVQQLEGNIRELRDLENRPVAIVASREAVDYLQTQNIQQVQDYTQIEPAYQALLDGKVDAVIASTPLLNYYVAHVGQGQVEIVGTPFLNQFYAIVMPKDSPYRKPINRALLTLKENGTYEQIYQKWFGIMP